MENHTSIVEGLKNKRCNSDMAQVFELWHAVGVGTKLARSSDQLVIRKAAGALERLGEAVSERLVPGQAARFRCLPEVGPTIRVRSAPSRFWLEIDPQGEAADWDSRTALFVEFSKDLVRFGIRLSTDRAALCRETVKTLRAAAANPHDGCDRWSLEQRQAPAPHSECPTDVNAWLAARSVAQQSDPVHATLSRTCAGGRLQFGDLMDGLREAAGILSAAVAPSRVPDPIRAGGTANCPPGQASRSVSPEGRGALLSN